MPEPIRNLMKCPKCKAIPGISAVTVDNNFMGGRSDCACGCEWEWGGELESTEFHDPNETDEEAEARYQASLDT